MYRKQFIDLVSNKVDNIYYDTMKNCIELNSPDDNIDVIDQWFSGIVSSVKRYQPNTKILVLVGEQAIGKSVFFKYLLPSDLLRGFSETFGIPNDYNIYEQFIVEVPAKSEIFSYASKHNGRFYKGNMNKRLCSFCCTTNIWPFNPRSSAIVLYVKNINWELLNNINRVNLWSEIFNKF